MPEYSCPFFDVVSQRFLMDKLWHFILLLCLLELIFRLCPRFAGKSRMLGKTDALYMSTLQILCLWGKGNTHLQMDVSIFHIIFR